MKILNRIFKQDKEKFKIPKSAQDIIPIQALWKDGIFLSGTNKYSKSYKFMDINYAVASKEDKEGIPKTYRWNDTIYQTIPSIIGKTKKEAKSLLYGLKIEFVGNGDKVIDSQPSENSRVKQGSTIKVMLN